MLTVVQYMETVLNATTRKKPPAGRLRLSAIHRSKRTVSAGVIDVVLRAWAVCEVREGLEKLLEDIPDQMADRLVQALLLPKSLLIEPVSLS